MIKGIQAWIVKEIQAGTDRGGRYIVLLNYLVCRYVVWFGIPNTRNILFYVHIKLIGGTQDALYIDWQEQLRIVASVVKEAVMFLSGARPNCLYNSSLLIYKLSSPPKRQNPLQPAGQGRAPTILSLFSLGVTGWTGLTSVVSIYKICLSSCRVHLCP